MQEGQPPSSSQGLGERGEGLSPQKQLFEELRQRLDPEKFPGMESTLAERHYVTPDGTTIGLQRMSLDKGRLEGWGIIVRPPDSRFVGSEAGTVERGATTPHEFYMLDSGTLNVGGLVDSPDEASRLVDLLRNSQELPSDNNASPHVSEATATHGASGERSSPQSELLSELRNALSPEAGAPDSARVRTLVSGNGTVITLIASSIHENDWHVWVQPQPHERTRFRVSGSGDAERERPYFVDVTESDFDGFDAITGDTLPLEERQQLTALLRDSREVEPNMDSQVDSSEAVQH